jgi:hypothetical protein
MSIPSLDKALPKHRDRQSERCSIVEDKPQKNVDGVASFEGLKTAVSDFSQLC